MPDWPASMTRAQYNAFCRALPAATHGVQWGGAHVWKIGGKVFAIGRWEDGEAFITFKAGEIAYEVLKGEPGLRPAPYLASRGLKWLQMHGAVLPAEEMRGHLRHSHAMVAAGLARKTRLALGLNAAEAASAPLPHRSSRSGAVRDRKGNETP